MRNKKNVQPGGVGRRQKNGRRGQRLFNCHSTTGAGKSQDGVFDPQLSLELDRIIVGIESSVTKQSRSRWLKRKAKLESKVFHPRQRAQWIGA